MNVYSDAMTDRNIVEQAVKAGIKSYADSRRRKITSFVETNFSFKGAWNLNKVAFGWDMLRAPANLAWMPIYFTAKIGGSATEKMGLRSLSGRLRTVPPGFRTDVERRVEWLLYSEFLELPFEGGGSVCEKNLLLTQILAEKELIGLFEERLRALADLQGDPTARKKLEEKLSTYLDNRKDVAELTTTLMALSASLVAHKGLNMGAVGLGQTTAAAIAHQIAVSNFFLGQTLGGVYYSFFPATASMGLVIGATGGVAAVLGVVSAFAGVLADPTQKALGLHHKKLHRLVDAIENQLLGEGRESYALRDGLIARILDLLDILGTVVPIPV